MRYLFLTLLLLFASSSYSQPTTFMPQNNLNHQDGLFDNGMSEEDFNAIIDSVLEYYGPIVENMGATLVINRLWTDTTVNAQAYKQGNTWYVDMFGGLARRPEITHDGFAMVVCHEVGHHLGGFPFVQYPMANEGQADYFAMHSCAKTIWKQNDETVVDTYSKKICDEYSNDTHLCYREMNAGQSLANLLAALEGGKKVNVQTPDKTIVRKTNDAHPKAQCRLDTYVAGTLCTTTWDNTIIPKSERESSNYLCINHTTDGYAIQARPRCWFKPTL